MPGAYAVSSTSIGFDKEITPGTAVPPAYWAKVKAPKYKSNLTVIQDDTLQGSMVNTYDATTGMRYDSHGWDTFPYLDILPLYVMAELGSTDNKHTKPPDTTLFAGRVAGSSSIQTNGTVAVGQWIAIDTGGILETHRVTTLGGTTAPYALGLDYPLLFTHAIGAQVVGLTRHDFSLLNNAGVGNQPPSFTLTDSDGEEWRQLARAQMDKFSLKIIPNKLVNLTVDWFADPATTPSPASPSFTTVKAVPSWTAQVSIGGQQIAYAEEIDIDLSRGVEPIEALTGNQAYYEYFARPLTAMAKITVIETAGAPELTAYLAGSQQSFDVTLMDRGSGFAVNFHSSNSMFTTGELVRGKEWVEATLDIQLLPTTADALAGGVSPIIVSIGNSTTTTY